MTEAPIKPPHATRRLLDLGQNASVFLGPAGVSQ